MLPKGGRASHVKHILHSPIQIIHSFVICRPGNMLQHYMTKTLKWRGSSLQSYSVLRQLYHHKHGEGRAFLLRNTTAGSSHPFPNTSALVFHHKPHAHLPATTQYSSSPFSSAINNITTGNHHKLPDHTPYPNSRRSLLYATDLSSSPSPFPLPYSPLNPSHVAISHVPSQRFHTSAQAFKKKKEPEKAPVKPMDMEIIVIDDKDEPLG